MIKLPRFPGKLQKNDALFLYGATRKLPWLFAYVQTRTEIVHGPSCRPEDEIFLDRCAEDRVPVIRRRGGGGTVVLSPGMAIVCVVGNRGEEATIDQLYQKVHGNLIPFLRQCTGLFIEQQGVSDLTVGGKKIAGSSLYLSREPACFYYQASIMAASDTTLIDRYLKHPPREPDYRAGRPHSEFCTTFYQLGVTISAEQLVDGINT